MFNVTSVKRPRRFTPIGAPSTDAFWAQTKFLLNADADPLVDATGTSTLTLVGTPVQNTSVFRYGTGSAFFRGSTNPTPFPYIYTPASSAYGIGTSDYTLDGNFRFAEDKRQALFDLRLLGAGGTSGAVSQARPFLYYFANTLYYVVNNANVFTRTFAPTLNTFYHIALSRVAGSVMLFIDGVMQGSPVSHTTNLSSTGQVTIGANADAIGNSVWMYSGYIDDLRVTVGTGRYSSNFTPAQAGVGAP